MATTITPVQYRAPRQMSNLPTGSTRWMNPAIVDAARRGDAPDGAIYDRPASNRVSSANLGMSIAVVLAATAMYLFVFLMFA